MVTSKNSNELDNFKGLLAYAFNATGMQNILQQGKWAFGTLSGEWGIFPKSDEECFCLMNFFVEKKVNSKATELLSQLANKIENLSIENQRKVLQDEIDDINYRKKEEYFFAGYQSQKLVRQVSEYCDFTPTTKRKNYEHCALGFAYAKYEIELVAKLTAITDGDYSESIEIIGESSLRSTTHKLVYKMATGTLQHLNEKYAKDCKNKTQFAKIVALDSGIDIKEAGTLRKYLDSLIFGEKVTQKNKVLTVTSLKAVERALQDVGIPSDYIEKELRKLAA